MENTKYSVSYTRTETILKEIINGEATRYVLLLSEKGKKTRTLKLDIHEHKWFHSLASKPKDILTNAQHLGYHLVQDLALSKANLPYTTAEHKALWQVLFNKPQEFTIHTDNLHPGNPNVIQLIGLVKWCLQYGVTVRVIIDNALHKVCRPITNLHRVQLFNEHEVDLIINNDDSFNALTPTLQNRAILKHTVLTNGRQAYLKKKVWPRLNPIINDITHRLDLAYQESFLESVGKAQRYALMDKFVQYDIIKARPKSSYAYYQLTSAELERWDTRTKDQQDILLDLRLKAQTYDLDIHLDEPTRMVTQHRPRHWNLKLEPHILHLFKTTSWYQRAWTQDSWLRNNNKFQLQARPSSWSELIDAYMQLQFYQENEPKSWIAAGLEPCPICGHAYPETTILCPTCDEPNPKVDETATWLVQRAQEESGLHLPPTPVKTYYVDPATLDTPRYSILEAAKQAAIKEKEYKELVQKALANR